MSWVSYLNITLWAIDTIGLASLLAVYFWFTKTYQNWRVFQINSGNDVIDSTTLNKLVQQFKILFNLKKYKVIFIDDEKAHKMFWNLKKAKKQIVITKRIFPSVGYELDYIISRLWLSSKELEKNKLVRWYKVLVKYLPTTLIVLICLGYFFNTVIFIFGLSAGTGGSFAAPFLEYLWFRPFLALLTMVFCGLLGIVFYLGTKTKEKIEVLYNREVLGLAKTVLETFFFDFAAARQYAQRIQIPFLLTFSSHHEKWLGPFTY